MSDKAESKTKTKKVEEPKAEEEVKLGAPLKLDPGHAVVVNHRLDDVVFLDLPHCGDRGLLLILSGRSSDGVGGVAHG